jgi:2-polyprenyl-6-methoxyphenol hydroxylase-like FAD-dependent oxidoreductase
MNLLGKMEECPVVIVGAGPAGLTLALSLAVHKVHSIILEKEEFVNEDPRGVAVVGDATRILYHIGIGEDIEAIGHRE